MTKRSALCFLSAEFPVGPCSLADHDERAIIGRRIAVQTAFERRPVNRPLSDPSYSAVAESDGGRCLAG
jgi:hypothetical protein